MTRLRVAFVAHSVDERRGGMELASARLLERLARDVDLEVVASDGLDTLPAGVRATRVPIPGAPSLARLVAFFLLGTPRLVPVRRRNDLVHTNGAIALVRADVVTVHLSHAAVVAAQGSARPPGRTGLGGRAAQLRRLLALALERAQFRPGRTRRLVALSANDARQLMARYPAVPVEVIPNGVDVARFRDVTRDERSGAQPLRVVVVAGDFERKGVALAVEAVAASQRCVLRVVGAGDLEAMRSLAARLGAAGRVELVGHLADVAPSLAWADVVLSCSSHESFGLALVEGAASGCAVVCTDTGVGPELVGDGDGGVLVARDALDVARALDELDADPARCAKLGRVARTRAERFSWDAMAEATLSLYQRLASSA